MEKFFLEPNNSHAREKILNHYLWFELEKAAAKFGYELQIYRPDTDHIGIDVFFDDIRTIKGFQIKTVMSTSKTAKWKIHKRLIIPHIENRKKLGIEVGGGQGIEGGIILLTIFFNTTKDDFTVELEYFDAYILKMWGNNIIRKKGINCNKLALNIYKCFKYDDNEYFNIPQSLFVKIKDPSALLGIAGFHNAYGTISSSYLYNLKEMPMWIKKDEIQNLSIKPKDIYELFIKMIDDPRISYAFE